MTSKIKLLSDRTISLIAAGEVVSGSSSVVKELVENAIDAGAKSITVEIERGGKNLIRVSDDGCGMDAEELPISLKRHATSKLDENDINNIQNFGFRGEALPSIAAVSELCITSRTLHAEHAWNICVNGAQQLQLKPASRGVGTTVEVRNLFSFTPARLKFLKSDATEKSSVVELMQKFALVHPDISFNLIADDKTIFNVKGGEYNETERINSILGQEFIENTITINAEVSYVKIHGFAGIPTYNHPSNYHQYFFINKRLIKDKTLFSSAKGAYYNLIPENRHAALLLFITLDPYEVDVNVHPAKTEVRFREPAKIRNFIITAIKKALEQSAPKTSINTAAVSNVLFQRQPDNSKHNSVRDIYSNQNRYMINAPLDLKVPSSGSIPQQHTASNIMRQSELQSEIKEEAGSLQPLGSARIQIANMYIIAENDNGIILVDQHAAHERLMLERIKQYKDLGKLSSQVLLIPEVIALNQSLVDKLVDAKEQLSVLGFGIERNGLSEVIVRQVPDILGCDDINKLIKEIAEYLNEHESIDIISKKVEEVFGNIACHSSIRAGRKLNLNEMNALLRAIEKTQLSSQCNHGRPTFIHLTEKDLEKIFSRS